MANALVDWLKDNATEWKANRDDNYLTAWKEYERLWRGVWDGADKLRESERSRIISPALQQAIENHASEIEEAIYGQGNHLFSIADDMDDKDPTDVEYIQNYITQNYKQNKVRKAIGDIILLGSIYGTGIGEVVVKKTKALRPKTQPLENMDMSMIGVEEYEKVSVSLNAISPQNFIPDPNANCIEEMMGMFIEEFVSAHSVAQKVKDGIYRETKIEDDSTPDREISPSWVDKDYDDDRVKILRYYGLVPKKLLDAKDSDVVELFPTETGPEHDILEEYGDMVEAICVIGNDEELLKAELSPYMMKDRPIVAYQDDTVPGRFWGRGVGEKGFNMQKAIDAQLRSHLDSLALTTVPMMGLDATRLPRGSKFEIRPGKSILTNGNPAEILMPFKFGSTDGSNITTAQAFEQMLLQATGTADTSLMQTTPVGGELSISLSGIIKKNKRTLVNFQENFLIPLVEKTAWRFMQFDPEHFPTKDFNFIPTGSLGILAREVEQLQFINLMKTLGPDSPLLPIIMKGVIENSSLPNKEALLGMLEKTQQPNPQEQQQQQQESQMKLAELQALLAKTQSEVELNKAKATNELVQAQTLPEEVRAKVMSAATNNLPTADDQAQVEFDRRVKIAELMLKEADLNQNAKIVEAQMKEKSGKVDIPNA